MRKFHVILIALVVLTAVIGWPLWRTHEHEQALAAEEEQRRHDAAYEQQVVEYEKALQAAIEKVGVRVVFIARSKDPANPSVSIGGGALLPDELESFKTADGTVIEACNESLERGDVVVVDNVLGGNQVGFLTAAEPCQIFDGDEHWDYLYFRRPPSNEGVEYPYNPGPFRNGPQFNGDLEVFFVPYALDQYSQRQTIDRLPPGQDVTVRARPDTFMFVAVSNTVPNPNFQVRYENENGPQETALINGTYLFPTPGTSVTIYRLK